MTTEEVEMVSLCSMRVDGRLYGIDTHEVQEVLGECDAHCVPLMPEFVLGLIPYRGDVLVTLSFRALLGLEPKKCLGSVMVLHDKQADELFGIAVDEVGGVLTLPASTLTENPCTLDARSHDLFAGAYRMADGIVVRLEPARMTPTKLMERARERCEGE